MYSNEFRCKLFLTVRSFIMNKAMAPILHLMNQQLSCRIRVEEALLIGYKNALKRYNNRECFNTSRSFRAIHIHASSNKASSYKTAIKSAPIDESAACSFSIRSAPFIIHHPSKLRRKLRLMGCNRMHLRLSDRPTGTISTSNIGNIGNIGLGHKAD